MKWSISPESGSLCDFLTLMPGAPNVEALLSMKGNDGTEPNGGRE